VDVRVVAATNRPLREGVERGTFRSDLYYRLNVLRMYLPPLRERRDDIVMLVRRFVQEFSQQHDREFRGISPEAMQALVSYSWPGNVRELRNLVESMVVLSHGREIGVDDIPPQLRGGSGMERLLPVHVGPVMREGEQAAGRELEFIVRSLLELKLQVEDLRRKVDDDRSHLSAIAAHGYVVGGVGSGGLLGAVAGGVEPPTAASPSNIVTITPGMTMAQIERSAIEAALRESRGNRRRAAEVLDIGERTLYRKLKEYGLPTGDYESDN